MPHRTSTTPVSFLDLPTEVQLIFAKQWSPQDIRQVLKAIGDQIPDIFHIHSDSTTDIPHMRYWYHRNIPLSPLNSHPSGGSSPIYLIEIMDPNRIDMVSLSKFTILNKNVIIVIEMAGLAHFVPSPKNGHRHPINALLARCLISDTVKVVLRHLRPEQQLSLFVDSLEFPHNLFIEDSECVILRDSRKSGVDHCLPKTIRAPTLINVDHCVLRGLHNQMLNRFDLGSYPSRTLTIEPHLIRPMSVHLGGKTPRHIGATEKVTVKYIGRISNISIKARKLELTFADSELHRGDMRAGPPPVPVVYGVDAPLLESLALGLDEASYIMKGIVAPLLMEGTGADTASCWAYRVLDHENMAGLEKNRRKSALLKS